MNQYPQGGMPPHNYQQYQPPVQQVIHYHQGPPKSAGAAVALELVPGFFFQTFGIGNIYAGNVGLGLAFLFGYWFVLFINILLCFILIGFITLPICWIAMMIIAPLSAASRASGSRY
jgi:hypothetical protein